MEAFSRDLFHGLLGAFLLIWQTVFEETAQPILVAAGVALVGVPIADMVIRGVNWKKKSQ